MADGARTLARAAAACVAAACATVACTTVEERRDPASEYRVEAAVDADSMRLERPVPGGLSPIVPAPRSAIPAEYRQQLAGSTQDPEAARLAASLRTEFGSQILLRPDGRVTKQYFVSGRSGDVVLNLLTEPGEEKPPANAPFEVGGETRSRSILGRQLGESRLEVLYLDEFEHPESVPIRAPVNHTAVLADTWPANSLLLITAEPDGLRGFERALNQFFADVPQVEIEVRVVEYSVNDSLSIGIDQFRDPATGDPISGPTLTQLSTNKLVEGVISRFPLTSPIAGAGSSGDRGLISLGGIHDSWQLDAQLQVLESRGIADVLSRPKLTVRNGGLASVTLTTDIPYPQARISSSGANVTANIVFKPVGVSLNIRPVIAGTDTVILQVFASVSAVTDFAATDPVPTPIISSREAVTSVHLTNGKTTVIGGLRSSSRFESETKFPILGDIPILGYLFRSTSEQNRETTVEFHITPSIIYGPEGLTGLGG